MPFRMCWAVDPHDQVPPSPDEAVGSSIDRRRLGLVGEHVPDDRAALADVDQRVPPSRRNAARRCRTADLPPVGKKTVSARAIALRSPVRGDDAAVELAQVGVGVVEELRPRSGLPGHSLARLVIDAEDSLAKRSTAGALEDLVDELLPTRRPTTSR